MVGLRTGPPEAGKGPGGEAPSRAAGIDQGQHLLRALSRVRTTPQARTLEPSLGGSVAAGLVHLGVYFSEEESEGLRLVWVSIGTATSLATVTGRLETVFCWTPVTSPWTLWAQDP